MCRLLTESLLGLHRTGDRMRITPCIPAHWQGYQLRYRLGASLYVIDVAQRPGAPQLTLDGVMQDDLSFPLSDDGATHALTLGWSGDAP